ncbi:telomere length regulator rif1 protein [Rutstroemia sp. NJR-2017a BBW]|nr:telomere length regulator rif1 protein [Rutstroemia sp. NJR-2017a BBW]
MVASILTPFFDARRLSKGKMDLVKDLLELLPTTGDVECCGPIWSLLAKFALQAINVRDETVTKNSIHTEHPVGGEYRNIVKILEIGLALSPNEPLEAWDTLFGALVTSASTDAGDGGRALAVIEPVAKALVSKWLPNDRQAPCNMFYCQLLLSEARYPKDRQALDAARTILWGTSTAGPKVVAFDPYFHLYDYMSRCLEASYVNLSAINEAQASSLLVTLEALLKRCPQKLWINFLIRVQDGLSSWFRDQDAKITHRSILFKHASIANIAIEMWKTTFESTNQDPQYPIAIRNALHKLASVIDIEILHTSGNLEASSFSTRGQFLPSLDQQDEPKINSIPRFMHKGKKLVTESETRNDRPRESVGKSSPCVLITVPGNQSRGKRSHETTPEPGKRKSRKKSSVGKLRHENSQIQFEAITGSSPISDAMEESQHLTERQKEVRERQREEAAFMFPDIRSSPRPRSGTPSKASEKSQPLPPHSSTKSRLLASANAVRQTTPDLRALDQDNFIASSPTPARKLSVPRGLSGPPSSSPELASQRDSLSPLFEEEALDIPSSPPQPTTVQNNPRRLATSFTSTSQKSPAPLAQAFPLTASENFDVTSLPNEILDTFGGDNPNRETPKTQVHILGLDPCQTFSTYRSTPQEHGDAGMDSTIELTSTEEHAREAYLRAHFDVEKADQTISSLIAKSPILEETLDLPSTPRSNLRNLSTHQIPDTQKDVFLDARSSPLSSDRAAGSDENFQDAVSSPRQVGVESQNLPVMPSASLPLSDLDESSLLRIVDQFEKDLSTTIVSTPVKKSKQNAADFEESVGTKANSTQRRLAPNPKTTHASGQSKPKNSRPNEPYVSSGLSLIPETPAPLPQKKAIRELGMEDADENLDSDLTVVVQAPDSWKLFNPSKSPNGGEKRNWTSIQTEDQDEAPSKKRKLAGTNRTESEVSDSQDPPLGIQSTASAMSQGNPRGKRGRPSNRGNKKQDISYLMSVEINSPPLGQSITSSMAETRLNRSTISEPVVTPEPITDPFSANPSSTRAERASRRRNRTAEIEASGVDTASVELGESSSAPIVMQTSSIIASGQVLATKSTSSAVVAQTSLDEDDGENPGAEADGSELDLVEETLLQSQLAEEMEMEERGDGIVAVEMEASGSPTYQSMRAKLSSLVDDLGKASLTRSEISDMEDLFMEAKIKLFGTMRRT